MFVHIFVRLSVPAASWNEELVVALDWTIIKCDRLLVCVHGKRLQTHQQPVSKHDSITQIASHSHMCCCPDEDLPQGHNVYEIKHRCKHMKDVVIQEVLTSFLSHTSMSYWWKNSILLIRMLSLSTFITCEISETPVKWRKFIKRLSCVCVELFAVLNLAQTCFVVR